MTPSTLPAIRPSYTRKLPVYFVPEAYLAIMRALVLHSTDWNEHRALAEFQQTFPFPDGEPTLDEYWRAFVAWRRRGEL